MYICAGIQLYLSQNIYVHACPRLTYTMFNIIPLYITNLYHVIFTVGTQLQIKPQISGSASPAGANADAVTVHNLSIIQGPDGQLQVLLPGMYLHLHYRLS